MHGRSDEHLTDGRGNGQVVLMFRVLPAFLWACFLGIAVSDTWASRYAPEDWVSYTDLRHISSLAADIRHVYMGTKQGVAVFDRISGKWTYSITTGDGLPGESVELVGIDKYTGRVLVSSGMSIHSMERDTETWQSYSVQGAVGEFTSMGADLDYIWAEAEDTKIRFDKMTGSWQPVNDLPEDIEWFGRRGEVNIEEPQYSFLAPFYVLGPSLERYDYTCAVRWEKSIWLGTSGLGAFEYDMLTHTAKHHLMGIAGGTASALCLDGEDFWFGSGGPATQGITRWEREKDRWTYYSKETEFGILSNRVSAIASDSEYVWIGTEEGLTRFRKGNSTFHTYTLFDGLPASEVTAVLAIGDSVWIGTSLGPCVSGRSLWSPNKFDELRTWVNDLLVLGDTLWAATEDGVFVMDISSGRWSELEYPEGLAGLSTSSLLADGEKIWFGTWRGVLSLDTRSGIWGRFTSPIHLPDERVLALAADSHNVWVGTVSGVAQLVKESSEWHKYGLSDGLISEQVSAIVCTRDHVYFGTSKGVTRHYWRNPFTVR
jgi:hypothetical protein